MKRYLLWQNINLLCPPSPRENTQLTINFYTILSHITNNSPGGMLSAKTLNSPAPQGDVVQ
jgi:hypothetical protein